MRTALPALHLFGGFLVATTLLPYVRRGWWWIRLWDFPRAQIAAAIGLVLGLYFATQSFGWYGDHLFVALLLISASVQLAQIYPYTPLMRVQVPNSRAAAPERRVRILIANVLMSNRRADDLLAMVDEVEPDLLLVMETDGWWDRRLRVLEPHFPHSLRCPLDNTYGMHLFSRLELRAAALRFLVEPEIPSVYAEVRLRSGEWIAFFGVHPRPPRVAQDTLERDAELLLVGHEAKQMHLPVIVAGDLNDVAWSHTTRLFQRISGLLDPRVGRGLYSTFHARVPLLRWPLDHLFHSAEFRLCDLRRLSDFGSDHFPILAELALEPAAARTVEIPVPEPGDRIEAIRKILQGVPVGARRRLRRLIASRRRPFGPRHARR